MIRIEDDRLCKEYTGYISDGIPNRFSTDWYNSLRASFSIDEINQQLINANLQAEIKISSMGFINVF